jgi:hypothetical protein
LRRCGEIGPGVVHRVIVETQRRFFDPPNLERSGWGNTASAASSPSQPRGG